MAKHRTSKLVGIVGIVVGALWISNIVLIPFVQGIAAGNWPVFSLFFGLLISIPAMLLISSGFQLTKECSRHEIKRTVGCLCIVVVYTCLSSLLSLAMEEQFDTWMSWASLVAAIVGIGLYAVSCNRLLVHEGFKTHSAEFFGEGQLSVLGLLLWLALSGSCEVFLEHESALVESASVFGPFVVAIVFVKVTRRMLKSWQQRYVDDSGRLAWQGSQVE